MGFEKPSSPVDIADYKDAPYYGHLLKLPPQLHAVHLRKIEREELSDVDATAYLEGVLNQREVATTETSFNDADYETLLKKHPELMANLDKSFYDDPYNQIGSGTTARIKVLNVTLDDGHQSQLAIKYVVSPNEKTLSASGEHEVLREVELLMSLERLEKEQRVDTDVIRVPHPVFHHKTKRIQCYGMERVQGVNLLEIIDRDDKFTDELRESIINSPLAKRTRKEIFAEVDKLYAAIHSYCLHGDIKPKNIMVDENGTFFIIDFGQAVMNTDVPNEKAMDQIENLRDDEIAHTKIAISQILLDLFGRKLE